MMTLNNRREYRVEDRVLMEIIFIGTRVEIKKRLNIEQMEDLRQFRQRADQIESEITYEENWNEEEKKNPRREYNSMFQRGHQGFQKDSTQQQNKNRNEQYKASNVYNQNKGSYSFKCFKCGTEGWRWRQCLRTGPCSKRQQIKQE